MADKDATLIEPLEDENILQKPKKPRTAKQIEAFEKGRLIRSENLKIKRDKIAEIKKEPIKKTVAKPAPAPEPIPAPDSESEEEVIVVKRKPKKKKKVIVFEDSESEDDAPPVKPPKLTRQVSTITPIVPSYNIKFVGLHY
jgi:hypothetical protein